MDISRYIGIPYQLGGRSFDGIDCYGLVWLFYRDELGIEIPRYEGNPDEIELAEISRLIAGSEEPEWREIPRDQVQLGDVVRLKIMAAHHVGIYIPEGRILHSMMKCSSSLEDLSRPRWRKRIWGYFRRAI